jgi:hypothetical protein
VCSNALVQLSEEVLQTHGLFAELHHTLERQDGSGTDISIVALFLEQLRKAEESSYATPEERVKAMQQMAEQLVLMREAFEAAHQTLQQDGTVCTVSRA